MQVFFYEKSGEGKILAEKIQEVLNKELEIVKPREIKSNVSYYLLKEVTIPIAIVECGFLTNPSEAVLLVNDEYQNKIAAAIAKGIKKYLEIKDELIMQESVTR
jgi:N-acetylmuramoyl-L-alanine amidase